LDLIATTPTWQGTGAARVNALKEASVTVLGFFVVWYLAVGFGVSIGYHRVLTHRAAQLARPALYLLVLLGLAAGPPAEWVGNHRRHHRYADTAADPHSPRWRGFWYAHCGWYLGLRSPVGCFLYACGGPLRLLIDAALRPVAPGGNAEFAEDVLSDPFLRWLSRRPGFVIASLLQLGPFAAAFALAAWEGLVLAWAFSMLMYNVGDSVDSVLHLAGRRDFETGDLARNSWLLGVLALGEGFHNGHHAFPSSARFGLLPGQLDASYALLRLLERLGLARGIRTPSASAVLGKRSTVAAAALANRMP
jgi:stearoyl-CoA desaturase (delta-9 desaturase)